MPTMPPTRFGNEPRKSLKDKWFTDILFGKLFADRGYISQDLFEKLFVDGHTPDHQNQEEHEELDDEPA